MYVPEFRYNNAYYIRKDIQNCSEEKAKRETMTVLNARYEAE